MTNLPVPVFISTPDGSEVHGPIHTFEGQADVIEEMKSRGIHEMERTPIDVVCDFCSHPAVRWCYQIKPGGVVVTVGEGENTETHGDLDGKWGACDECNRLIQAREWMTLVDRAAEMTIQRHPEIVRSSTPMSLALGIISSHGYFASRWDGSAPEPMITDADFIQSLDKGNQHG